MTQAIFDNKIIDKNKPCVLVFGAKWSGNTQMMDSIVLKVARTTEENVEFFKVDIEEHDEISAFFGVYQVPTIVMIRKGEVLEKVQGLISANKLRKKIAENFPST